MRIKIECKYNFKDNHALKRLALSQPLGFLSREKTNLAIIITYTQFWSRKTKYG